MKYGEQFENESAPQWSLHNIDYNSLKHHIKVHTTKDQATAISIPGHQDTALRLFEDELYSELCRQHDRVDLFVSSKADEIARRLQHLSNQIHRLLIRCAISRTERMSLRKQRRFAKHENDLLQCGNDIKSLQRFVGAQVVAFRKILKKYRKWTGSSTLGSRFRDTILSHPKSFTRRDFSHLQSECDSVMATLRAAIPAKLDGTSSPLTASSAPSIRRSEQASPTETIVASEARQTGYWNEYDYGSEAGDGDQFGDGSYAIYINPDEETGFPGIETLKALFTAPTKLIKKWTSKSSQPEECDEEAPILSRSPPTGYGSVHSGYFTQLPGGSISDTEAEDESRNAVSRGRRISYGYASSEEFPVGYKTYNAALPSIEQQHLSHYKDRVLCLATWACFGVSFVLMGIAALLIKTGRHKMRLEVDAGVTLGIMASLGAACAALGMTFSRQQPPGWPMTISVWVGFMVACVLNGILLVLVVGNSPL
ncbi:hypothetical protein OQA88_9762 [Cercophora sp. LCS_1]